MPSRSPLHHHADHVPAVLVVSQGCSHGTRSCAATDPAPTISPTAISTRCPGGRRDHQATSGDGEHRRHEAPPGEQVAERTRKARPIA